MNEKQVDLHFPALEKHWTFALTGVNVFAERMPFFPSKNRLQGRGGTKSWPITW
jgi:hypothetical protein